MHLHVLPDAIADQLVIAHADCRAALAAIARRTTGASSEDLLLASLALLREQAARIAGLEQELADVEETRDQIAPIFNRLESNVAAVEQELSDLRTAMAAKANW